MALENWKLETLEFLDGQTPLRLQLQYQSGGVTDKSELTLTLGLPPERMRIFARKINGIIGKYSRKGLTVSSTELEELETLGDLFALIKGKL